MDESTLNDRAPRPLKERILRPSFVTGGGWWLWPAALAFIALGLISFGLLALDDNIVFGLITMWCFCLAGVAIALVLPLPYALVSPLFAGLAGWLVDMLPLVILVSWLAVLGRWAYGLIRVRRMPRGGRWRWIPAFLVFWTSLGVLVINSLDLKHFALLLGVQILASATVLLLLDALGDLEDRVRVACGLVLLVVVMSVGVLLQWVGVPIQPMQNSVTKSRVESAYGLDAFPNETGMIKYARSQNAGTEDLRAELRKLKDKNPGLPEYDAFTPGFKAFRNQLVVRFDGSARAFEAQLA
ncbi:MAG: hypothetical protein QOK47_1447, partial [Actinomycetota bacterium]|nr:hypothetical protein [Actinomycetota bacterium]